MVTAQAAWDLAELGRARFVLGLGTQVKAHVVRRFSAPFDQPVTRLRDYIHALRAIFRAFQGQEKLRSRGRDHVLPGVRGGRGYPAGDRRAARGHRPADRLLRVDP
jgi:alkanesulfonate monooxygenase SsuD/methylene tetrahydromethanopterin reductase-like flavin-dependent oxidoreductase (luciferase family)